MAAQQLNVKQTLDKPLTMDEISELDDAMDKVKFKIAELATAIGDPSQPWLKDNMSEADKTKYDKMSVATALEGYGVKPAAALEGLSAAARQQQRQAPRGAELPRPAVPGERRPVRDHREGAEGSADGLLEGAGDLPLRRRLPDARLRDAEGRQSPARMRGPTAPGGHGSPTRRRRRQIQSQGGLEARATTRLQAGGLPNRTSNSTTM